MHKLLTILACTAASAAFAEETKLHYTVEVTSVSSYIFRGDRVSADLMKPALQPYAELGVSDLGPGSLAVGVWSSTPLAENATAEEVDPYAFYTLPTGLVDLRAGYTLYLLPEQKVVDAMHELTLQGTTTWSFPIQLYLGAGADPFRAKGVYGFGGAKWSQNLGSWALSAQLNVGGAAYAAFAASLQDVTLSARVAYNFGETGVYAALSGAGVWSGRAETTYPYAGLSVGFAQ